MKYLFLFALLSSVCPVTAQEYRKNPAADKVLTSVLQKLKSFNRISYHYDREMKYHSDNYHATSEADVYMEFVTGSPTGLRFQSKNATRRFIYNGEQSLRLDNTEMTIDSSAAKTEQSISNNSDLYHSFAMLRNVLPLVIGNDSIQKFISDTSINGKPYLCIRMEAPKTSLGIFNGIQHFDLAGLHRPCATCSLIEIQDYHINSSKNTSMGKMRVIFRALSIPISIQIQNRQPAIPGITKRMQPLTNLINRLSGSP